MPQRPASADWHGQIIRYPRQTLVGPGQWHEGPEPLHTAGAGFYLWWRHEEAPVRFQRPRPPRWMLIGPFTTRAAAVRHRKAMAAAGGAGRSTGRMAPVQDQGAKQWTAAQARRFGRGYGSSIYAAEARGDDREAGRLLDEFEARDAALSPALSRIFVEAYQAARWKRLPGGRRAPAAMRIGKTIYEILDTTRVQTRRGAATLWKLRGPDGKEHKLERFDGRGQPYYKSSRWSRPHPIAAGEVRYLPATVGERPKPARPARAPAARGVQTHIVSPMVGEGGQHLVTVNPGVWVRLHGTRTVWAWTRVGKGPGTGMGMGMGMGMGGPVLKPYDLTFKLGDDAVNGSYNLTYTGVIESIGPKRILIVGVPVGRKSMDLRSFSFYNRDFDAGRIARENADTSMRI